MLGLEATEKKANRGKIMVQGREPRTNKQKGGKSDYFN